MGRLKYVKSLTAHWFPSVLQELGLVDIYIQPVGKDNSQLLKKNSQVVPFLHYSDWCCFTTVHQLEVSKMHLFDKNNS